MISNSGFETQDPGFARPGVPAEWTITIGGTLEETATFAGDSAYTDGGYETFEHGWSELDPEVLLSALVSVEARLAETFALWSVNQGVLYLAALESAAFTNNTVAVESFADWKQRSSDIIDMGSVEHAATDAFTWADRITSLTSVETFGFGKSTGALALLAEVFQLKDKQETIANSTANQLIRYDHANFDASVGELVWVIPKPGAVLPNGLDPTAFYTVAAVTGQAIKLKTSNDGVEVDILDAGVGTQYVMPDPGRFWFEEIQ